jgi:hypothetical protein
LKPNSLPPIHHLQFRIDRHIFQAQTLQILEFYVKSSHDRPTNEWRIDSGVISRFDINEASSWWRSWTTKGVCSSWSWSPLSLVYRISPNSHTLVILLQVNLTSGDEPKIVYEGCYETKDTFIFAWSSIFSIRHYCWLCNLIR